MIFIGIQWDWTLGYAFTDQMSVVWLGPLRLGVFHVRRP